MKFSRWLDSNIAQFKTRWKVSGFEVLYGNGVKMIQFITTLVEKSMNLLAGMMVQVLRHRMTSKQHPQEVLEREDPHRNIEKTQGDETQVVIGGVLCLQIQGFEWETSYTQRTMNTTLGQYFCKGLRKTHKSAYGISTHARGFETFVYASKRAKG